MSERIRIQLLGKVALTIGDREISRFTTSRNAALLAYLALHPNPVERSRVAQALWPDKDPDAAKSGLRTALYSIEKDIGHGILEATRVDVGFAEPVEVDVAVFLENAKKSVRALESADERLHLEEAIHAYTGPLAPQLTDDWIVIEREHLEDRAQDARLRLARIREAAGSYEAALEVARSATRARPVDEGAHCAEIRLLARLGNRAGAVARHKSFRRRLAKELELRPSRATEGLFDAIASGAYDPLATPEEAHVGFIDEAIDYYLVANPERATALLASAYDFWQSRRNDRTGLDTVLRVLAADAGTPLQKAWVFRLAGYLCINQAIFPDSQTYFERAIELFKEVGEKDQEVATIGQYAYSLGISGNLEVGRDKLLAQLPSLDSLHDSRIAAVLLNNLGGMVWFLGDRPKALEYYRQSLAILRKFGNTSNSVVILSNICILHAQMGNAALGADAAKQAVELAQVFGDTIAESFAQLAAAYVHLDGSVPGDFRAPLRHSLRLALNCSYPRFVLLAVEALAIGLCYEGAFADSAALLAGARVERGRQGNEFRPVEREEYEKYIGILRTALGEIEFERAREYGEQLGEGELAALAFELISRATVKKTPMD